MILSSVSTALVNLIVFSAIPFLWWLIRYRKKTHFLHGWGFIPPNSRVGGMCFFYLP